MRKVIEAPKVTVKPSDINPGRFGFYLNGSYTGSAGTRAEAMRLGKEMAETARAHWQAAEDERI